MSQSSFDNLIEQIKNLNKQQQLVILKLLSENKQHKQHKQHKQQVLTDEEYLFIKNILHY